MDSVITAPRPLALPRWQEVVWPKEHGSWSLAFEPLALGLLAVPSLGGAALALAATALFFMRRPLRIASTDAREVRRIVATRSLVVLALVTVAASVAAMFAAGAQWLAWLTPSAIGGAVFAALDLRQSGREQAAEVAGTVAFAWLPAVIAVLAGAPAPLAAALGAIMLGRAVPTVLAVRATVRARKTGERRVVVPVLAALVALVAAVALARAGLAPMTAVVALAALALRTFVLLIFPRPSLRAATIGMLEAALGIGFVVAVAIAWRW